MAAKNSMAAAFMSAAEDQVEEKPSIEYEKKLSRTLSNQSGMGCLDTEWQKEQQAAADAPARSLSRTDSVQGGIGGPEAAEAPGFAPERQLSRTLSNPIGIGGLDNEPRDPPAAGSAAPNRSLSRTVSRRDDVGGLE
eukprot:Selendium_serpulae@DN2607_c1_g1_i1.p1